MLWTISVLLVGIYIGVRFDDVLTAFVIDLKDRVVNLKRKVIG